MIADIAQTDVELTFRQFGTPTFYTHRPEMNSALNDCCTEEDGVVIPCELIDIGVKMLADETAFAGLKVHNHQAVLVTLVAVPLHG